MNHSSYKTWPFLTFALSACALVLFGCDSDSLERPPPNASLDLSAGTNRLFTWNMQDGKTVTAFGEKTAEGGIRHLTGARVQFPEDDNPYQYVFDEQNRPTRVRTANGAEYQFSWREDGTARVNFRAPSDTLQVSFVFDPTAPADSSSDAQTASAVLKSGGPQTSSVRDGKLGIEVRPSPHKGCVTSSSSASEDDLSPSIVNVSKCGGPVDDADVTMYAIVNGENRGPIGLGSYAGGGRYAVDVPRPSDLAATLDVPRFCNALEGNIDTFCSLAEGFRGAGGTAGFCVQLSAAVDVALGGPTGEGIPVGLSCAAVAAIYEVLCAFPTLGCEALDALDIGEADVAVYPEIRTDSDFRKAEEKPVPDDDPPPSFDVAFSGTVSIENLATVPADPDPAEDYIASTQIYCPAPGTEVTISVVGTDGYTDSRTVTLNESSAIYLDVPGAEENVRDDITVEVENGPTLSTQIVF